MSAGTSHTAEMSRLDAPIEIRPCSAEREGMDSHPQADTSRPGVTADERIVPLLEVLWAAGIPTLCSCQGGEECAEHGVGPTWIVVDGLDAALRVADAAIAEGLRVEVCADPSADGHPGSGLDVELWIDHAILDRVPAIAERLGVPMPDVPPSASAATARARRRGIAPAIETFGIAAYVAAAIAIVTMGTAGLPLPASSRAAIAVLFASGMLALLFPRVGGRIAELGRLAFGIIAVLAATIAVTGI